MQLDLMFVEFLRLVEYVTDYCWLDLFEGLASACIADLLLLMMVNF